MPKAIHLGKVVKRVGKRVPEAELGTTEERLPRWSFAKRSAWLEYNADGTLLLRGSKGGESTVTRNTSARIVHPILLTSSPGF